MTIARGEQFVPVDIMHLDAKSPRVHATHQTIIDAIQAQDAIKAEAEMRRHIQIVKELTNRALEASGIVP